MDDHGFLRLTALAALISPVCQDAINGFFGQPFIEIVEEGALAVEPCPAFLRGVEAAHGVNVVITRRGEYVAEAQKCFHGPLSESRVHKVDFIRQEARDKTPSESRDANSNISGIPA